MKKKQLLYIIGWIVVALIVLLLVIRLAFGALRGGGNGSSGYVNPPARLVQVIAGSPGSREANQLQSSIPGLK